LFRWRRWFSVADDCGIADDRFEPFIDVPTNFGEGPLWVKLRKARNEHILSAHAPTTEMCRSLMAVVLE
jgi:hypothetical protein